MDSGNASLCEGPYEELFRALEEGKVDIDIEGAHPLVPQEIWEPIPVPCVKVARTEGQESRSALSASMAMVGSPQERPPNKLKRSAPHQQVFSYGIRSAANKRALRSEEESAAVVAAASVTAPGVGANSPLGSDPAPVMTTVANTVATPASIDLLFQSLAKDPDPLLAEYQGDPVLIRKALLEVCSPDLLKETLTADTIKGFVRVRAQLKEVHAQRQLVLEERHRVQEEAARARDAIQKEREELQRLKLGLLSEKKVLEEKAARESEQSFLMREQLTRQVQQQYEQEQEQEQREQQEQRHQSLQDDEQEEVIAPAVSRASKLYEDFGWIDSNNGPNVHNAAPPSKDVTPAYLLLETFRKMDDGRLADEGSTSLMRAGRGSDRRKPFLGDASNDDDTPLRREIDRWLAAGNDMKLTRALKKLKSFDDLEGPKRRISKSKGSDIQTMPALTSLVATEAPVKRKRGRPSRADLEMRARLQEFQQAALDDTTQAQLHFADLPDDNLAVCAECGPYYPSEKGFVPRQDVETVLNRICASANLTKNDFKRVKRDLEQYFQADVTSYESSILNALSSRFEDAISIAPFTAESGAIGGAGTLLHHSHWPEPPPPMDVFLGPHEPEGIFFGSEELHFEEDSLLASDARYIPHAEALPAASVAPISRPETPRQQPPPAVQEGPPSWKPQALAGSAPLIEQPKIRSDDPATWATLSVFNFESPGNCFRESDFAVDAPTGRLRIGSQCVRLAKSALKEVNGGGEDSESCGLSPTFMHELLLLQRIKNVHLQALRLVVLGDPNLSQVSLAFNSHLPLSTVVAHHQIAMDCLKRIMFGTISGLAYLHANGEPHGNLCPESVVFSSQGCVQLTDWWRSNGEFAQGSMVCAAPEVLFMSRGERTRRDSSLMRGDAWSLACVFLFALQGKGSFFGSADCVNVEEIMHHAGTLLGVPEGDYLANSNGKSQAHLPDLFDEPGQVPSIFSYLTKISEKGRFMIRQMLSWNAERRPKIASLISHPFFHEEAPRPMEQHDLSAFIGHLFTTLGL